MQYSEIYNFLGRQAYKLVLPIMRILIRRTERVYVVIKHDGQVLLAKNWLGRQDWQLPGGGKRAYETPYQTAVREVKEEIGISLRREDIKPVKDGRWRTDGMDFKYSIVSVRLESKPEISLRSWEVIDSLWTPTKKIGELNLAPEIADAIRSKNT